MTRNKQRGDATASHYQSTADSPQNARIGADGTMTTTTNSRATGDVLRLLRRPVVGDSDEVTLSGGSFRRLLVWSLLLLLLVPMFFGLFSSGSGGSLLGSMPAAHAAEDEEEDPEEAIDEAGLGSYSFYNMSANLASVFSETNAPGGPGVWSEQNDVDTPIGPEIARNPGTAGSFVGYLDPSIMDDGFSDWLFSNLSASSAAMSYDSLIYDDADVSGDSYQGFYNYATYGAALSDMGFAETSMGVSFFSGINAAMGGIIWIFWVVSYIVDFTFWLFVQILVALNPFRWFYEGVNAVSPELADGMTGGMGAESSVTLGIPDNETTGSALNVELPNALQGLVTWIGDWYQILYAMSWAVMVPLFLAVFVFGLLLYKRMDRGSATKKLLVRLFFIVFGLPIMGSMYSATLSSMSEGLNPGSTGSTQVVLSTYVDFENWATQQRLAVPDRERGTIEWDTESNSVSTATLGDLRRTALEINTMTHDGLAPISPEAFESDNATWSDAQMEGMRQEDGHSSDEQGNFSIVSGIVTRSMFMDHTTASGFETSIKARAADRVRANHADAETVQSWFDVAESADDDNLHRNPLVSMSTAAENGDGLRAHYGRGDNPDNIITYWTRGSADCTEMQFWTGYGGSDASPNPCNMAPLAVFNFLNTSFDSTSMTVYSSGNVASEYTRQTYNSVNPVGTGVMRYAIFINSLALLVSFVLIGLFYAFAMLFGAFRRTFQVIGAVPFATLGAMGGISKVIIYTLALIIQTLGTVLMYMFVQSMLIGLPGIIEMPFAALMEWADGGALGFLSGSVVTIFTILLSIIATIVITIVAIKARSSIMKAIEEGVQKLVEKLTGSGSGANAGPGAVGRAAQGAAAGAGAGAGAAAANRGMHAMRGGGRSSANSTKRANASGTNPKGPVTDGVPKPGQGSGPNGQLTAAEQAKAVEAAGGSADPNSDNYDKRHPDAPDYDGSTDGVEGVGGEQAGDEQGGQGMTQASAEQMGRASDDVAEGRRLEKTGLSEDGNGHAAEPGAAGADGGQGDGSETFDQTADRVDSDVESALHDERSVSEQGRDLAASTGDQAKGVGHAALGNEDKAAEHGERAEERVTGESSDSHTEGAASEGSDRHDVEAGQDAQSDRSSEEQRAEQERAERERSEQESREAQTAGDNRHDVQAGTDAQSDRSSQERLAGADQRSDRSSADTQREVQAGQDQATDRSDLQNQSDTQSTESQRESASGPQAAGQEAAASTREGDRLSQTSQQNAAVDASGKVDARSTAYGGDQRSALNQQGDVSHSAEQSTADQRVSQQQDVDQRQQSPSPGDAGAAVPAKGGTPKGRPAQGVPGAAPVKGAQAPKGQPGTSSAPKVPQPKGGDQPAQGRKPAKGQPEAKPGRTRAAAEGGTKGAVKGAAGGAAVGATAGVVGGPKGMAAGAAKGAAVGAKYGAKTGATSGALKRDTSGNLNPLKVGKKASKRPKSAGKKGGRKPAPQPPAGQRGPAQAQPPAPRPAPKQGPAAPGPQPGQRPRPDRPDQDR